MKSRLDIVRRRLENEHLVGAPLARPEDVVRWLGAVQAQDYAGAKWGVAQRAAACGDADVEEAFQSGRILRTHVLRPTWHFVMPADVRWMLQLTAPRIKAAMGHYDRKLDLTPAVYARSNAAIAVALQGGVHLTRQELARVLDAAGIAARGQRLGHLMVRAELDAVVCSGPRRGKQFTYALLD
ncbi:MAG TPA: crosslink repair DNA glycosylase YcaQ family protein, partial [Candidatus Acidoferrum sp.]|nr:crosslink repair DNA glycosylase YcaQ family protein [Candidatus Acidoferrum sp.]